jgi:hypothetical protein
MKKLSISLGAITLMLFVSLYVLAEEQGKADYGWLNGKWAGPAEGGGTLTMDLKLVKGIEVEGLGIIPLGGSKSAKPIVHGIVDGKQVALELYYIEDINWRSDDEFWQNDFRSTDGLHTLRLSISLLR